MINRECNCQNKVNSRKLAVLKNSMEKYLLRKRISALKKVGDIKK